MMFRELSQRLDKVEADVENIKQTIRNQSMNTPSTPVPADIFITPQSLNKVRNDLRRMLN